MLRETGYCAGVENYSRHLGGRDEGSTPYTLMDYFPEDYLLFIDESHMTCRRYAPCTTATALASKCWWSTVSACRPLSTIAL